MTIDAMGCQRFEICVDEILADINLKANQGKFVKKPFFDEILKRNIGGDSVTPRNR